MKSISLSLKQHQLFFQIGLVCLADGLVGVSFGALAVTSGFELWVPLSLSVLVLAGASEFLFMALIASGGSAIAAAVAGLLVNARLLAFGLSLNQQLGQGWQRYLGCHLMNDESVVFGISQTNDYLNKKAYWLCGLGILLLWPFGVFIGAILGDAIQDPHVFGLDAMFPAILIALVLPKLDNSKKRYRAMTGALVSIVSTPLVPVGMPALLSLVGIFVKRGRQHG